MPDELRGAAIIRSGALCFQAVTSVRHIFVNMIPQELLQGTNVHLDFEDELIRFCPAQIEGRSDLTKHNRDHKSRIRISTDELYPGGQRSNLNDTS